MRIVRAGHGRNGWLGDGRLALAAQCACHAMIGYFHPQMIAQSQNKPGPSVEQMADFVLASLAPRTGIK